MELDYLRSRKFGLALLAGVVTDLLVITAPFSADLTDWLSRTAAGGLASRPSRSRKAMCSSGRKRMMDRANLPLYVRNRRREIRSPCALLMS